MASPYHGHFGMHGRICGMYYTCRGATTNGTELSSLPLVDIQAHASILSFTSRTVLKQTFINPSETKGIKELRYMFPLHDGVSVVGFTCRIRDRVIVGEVKERDRAKAVFKEAVARGETAGLLEQLKEASDVFTTTIGNVPPGERVVVTLTYLGELKHDMGVDGIRYTIPTHICPRYGVVGPGIEGERAPQAQGRGISITVDVEVGEGSIIQKVQSPSHPISVSMGTTSIAPDGDPSMTKATASLSLETAGLETDFILQIVAKQSGIPRAILETHPRIPNHRALMATLVPKFALPAEKPEIVFMVDRSGSMSGSNIQLTIQALKVFLKSLPVGVKFNICSFGSRYSFLWAQSKTYTQETLAAALTHVEFMDANFGGTEMLQPLEAIIKQRYTDIPLDVMLLTDGQIWNQQALFSSLNREVAQAKMPMRVFTLGVGNGVSLALVEGIARAGNGFCQTVADGEKMDSKVVRMLKGALSPHVHDYTLEVKYSGKSNGNEVPEDYEVVEKVADALMTKLDLKDDEKTKSPQKPISLYDESVDPDQEEKTADDDSGQSKYAYLPNLSVPCIIQTPQKIPSLFAFNRTTVYLLLGPESTKMTPKSVILRGTSQHGPLELEIPVQVLDTPGETIHQLAAKKAIAELEEGRGWLPDAKDAKTGNPVKDQYPSRFSDMVEREAVRLGVQFQVGGKWCSFVAVEKKDTTTGQEVGEDWEWLDATYTPPGSEDGKGELTPADRKKAVTDNINRLVERGEHLPPRTGNLSLFGNASAGRSLFGSNSVWTSPLQGSFELSADAAPPPPPGAGPSPFAGMRAAPACPPPAQATGGSLFGRPASAQPFGMNVASSSGPPSASLFGSAAPPTSPPSGSSLFGSASTSRPLFGQAASPGSATAPAPSLFGSAAPPTRSTGSFLFGSAAPPTGSSGSSLFGSAAPPTRSGGFRLFGGFRGAAPPTRSTVSSLFGSAAAATTIPPNPASGPTPDASLDRIIALQSFDGYWNGTPELFSLLGVAPEKIAGLQSNFNCEVKVLVTALVLAFLERKLASKKEVWELVGEKARGWLQGQGEGDIEGLIGKVGGVLEE